MVVVTRGRIPADQLALQETLDELPDVEIEVERVVKNGEQTVMPLLWVRGANAAAFEAVAGEDPSTDNVALLADFDEEQLYRMDWVDRVGLLLQMLTNSHATILDAYGADDVWNLRILFPTRDGFADTHEFCDRHGVTFTIDSVREMDGQPRGRYGLTEGQYAALVAAQQRGYFEVPRETTLEELAAELDISHQALSERIRRGCDTLVEDTLLAGVDPE